MNPLFRKFVIPVPKTVYIAEPMYYNNDDDDEKTAFIYESDSINKKAFLSITLLNESKLEVKCDIKNTDFKSYDKSVPDYMQIIKGKSESLEVIIDNRCELMSVNNINNITNINKYGIYQYFPTYKEMYFYYHINYEPDKYDETVAKILNLFNTTLDKEVIYEE